MLFWFPIENLDARYSTQWNEWFPNEFERLHVPYTTIYPQVSGMREQITDGQFLDVTGTHIFKFAQLQEFLRLVQAAQVKDGDVVLLADLWFPGLEALFYVRQALGIKFYIAGYLHAGTYDPHDFLTQKGMASWGAPLENAWFSEVDAIFVHTRFNFRLLRMTRHRARAKIIHEVSFPLYVDEQWRESTKEDLIVFPHRLAPEKQPDVFDRLQETLLARHSKWKFIKTQAVPRSKVEYYNLLRLAKISFSAALQETWGVSTQEALQLGCIPIVPDRLAYQDLYPKPLRYRSFEQAVELVETYVTHYAENVNTPMLDNCRTQSREDTESAIERIVNVLRSFPNARM